MTATQEGYDNILKWCLDNDLLNLDNDKITNIINEAIKFNKYNIIEWLLDNKIIFTFLKI